jgi:hypothetical protein
MFVFGLRVCAMRDPSHEGDGTEKIARGSCVNVFKFCVFTA